MISELKNLGVKLYHHSIRVSFRHTAGSGGSSSSWSHCTGVFSFNLINKNGFNITTFDDLYKALIRYEKSSLYSYLPCSGVVYGSISSMDADSSFITEVGRYDGGGEPQLMILSHRVDKLISPTSVAGLIYYILKSDITKILDNSFELS